MTYILVLIILGTHKAAIDHIPGFKTVEDCITAAKLAAPYVRQTICLPQATDIPQPKPLTNQRLGEREMGR